MSTSAAQNTKPQAREKPSAAARTTAEDTLKEKSRDANVISGGHLVAKALKAEGVDTIFTLCGGHIIDIYDGCLDEGIRIVDVRHEQTAAHAADGYARQTGKLGCVVTTAGPGCTNAVTGIATAFRSESPVLHIGGQSALNQWKMGGLQDLPHVDMMKPITKFASTVMSTERVADMIVDGGARMLRWRLWAVLSRDPARRARSRDRCREGRAAEARPLSRLDEIDRRSARYREARRHPGECRAARPSSSASRSSPRAAMRRRSRFCAASTFPAISTARAAASCRPAIRIISTARARSPSARPMSIVIVGTPFDFRMGYGKRINVPTLVQIDMDYRTVGKNRDVTLGIVGDPGAVAVGGAAGRLRAPQERQAPARRQWMKELTRGRGGSDDRS